MAKSSTITQPARILASAFTSPVRLGDAALDEDLDRMFTNMWEQEARERESRWMD